LKDTSGRVLQWFGTNTDVNELKRVEQELRESEIRFRTLFESMSEGFSINEIICDDAGKPHDLRYLDINPAFEHHTGLKAADILGKTTMELFPDAEPIWFERYGKVALTGEPAHFEEQFGPLGRWFEISSYQTEPGRFAVVFYDITERKRAEEALQRANNELAKQVEERSRELREKEVLLKEVHHRVKNNLQVISSLVSLQADGSQDETVREVLREVTDRVRSMAMVHEKLYQSTDLAHINFADYAHSLLNYLWRAHGKAAASVELTFDIEPVSLPVDAAVPCGLILNELAGNALKHAFRGRAGGEVTVSLHNGEGGRIRLSVSDNGIGLPEGFDLHGSKSLGLRLVQMLARQVDAGVEVSSVGGTRFEVSFSRGVAENAANTTMSKEGVVVTPPVLSLT
jgi:PAS domain S-box-containing protein